MKAGTDAAENEDWGEAVALWILSRQQGGLVRVTQDDGSVRTYTFEDMYPNRARIFEEWYGRTKSLAAPPVTPGHQPGA